MDVVPHHDTEPLKDEEKQRLLNALNDLDEPADDCAGTDPTDNVLTGEETSDQTLHSPLDFFNTYTGFGTFERLATDMSWTSTPLLWNITEATERHEWHRLEMVKNKRLQRQLQSAKKSATKQFRPSGRPPRHSFEMIGTTGVCEIAEAISSCFGNTLQRFTFEMSTRELQAENNNAEELDPRQCLIVKMIKTDVELKQPTEEIRAFGSHILVRDADETHIFENESDGISLFRSVNTSGLIRLVVPKEPDLCGQLIGCIETSTVRTMDLQGNHHQTVQVEDALCGTWTAVPVMHVGGKLHISHIDVRQGTANVVWTDESSHISDIATCWWNPYQICATTRRPFSTMKLFDVRKMDSILDDVGLPERGELQAHFHPLHKDRRFECAWCMGKFPWMYSYCLGGYDLVFKSMGNAHGATTSYHDDLESCKAFDSCEGCGAVRLENRVQSSLALVQCMAKTGPTAVWLEPPQPYTARSSKTSSPNDSADKDSNQRKVIDSYVGSIIAALPSSDSSFAGDQTALKEDMVARMLEYSEAESDYCALFPVLWGILREEMRTSNPDAGVSKAALLVLGGSCELRLTLSDAQSTVEVPANVLSSLDEYVNEQIAGSCLVIPLMECREEGICTGFQLQSLADIKTAISSRSLNPLKTAPDPPPHLVADAAMLAGMHWLEMEDLAVLHLLRECGLVVASFPVEEGYDLHRSGSIAHRKERDGIEEHNRIEQRRTFQRELQGLSRAKLHLQKGGLSLADEETMRKCLGKGEPLFVCFWSPAKRLRAIMALLNLADLPEGWKISNLSEMPLGHSFTSSDLVGVARAHETGHANHRHAARTGVRLLVRALLRCGLLACSSTIPRDSPESGTECYTLNVGQSALEMNASHCGQRTAILQEHAKTLNRILSLTQRGSCEEVHLFERVQELMQHAFTLLGSSPLVTWKKTLAKPTLPLQWSLGRSFEDPQQRDAEGIHIDEMWHKLLCRLRREDWSKIYAWLARQEDMFHLIPGDQTLLVVEQFGRVNVAKLFCQVAQMVKERLNTDDFSVELQLELLKFEGADQIARATSARTHMLRDSWDAFASKVTADAERQSKKARL